VILLNSRQGCRWARSTLSILSELAVDFHEVETLPRGLFVLAHQREKQMVGSTYEVDFRKSQQVCLAPARGVEIDWLADWLVVAEHLHDARVRTDVWSLGNRDGCDV
jgi:hypothetical protein